jgi:hypothetical protein
MDGLPLDGSRPLLVVGYAQSLVNIGRQHNLQVVAALPQALSLIQPEEKGVVKAIG